MTVYEYAVKIRNRIKDCKSIDQAREILVEAQKVIEKSKISPSSREKFWIELYNSLDYSIRMDGSLYYTSESQDASALSAIIAAAKQVIAQNIAQKMK